MPFIQANAINLPLCRLKIALFFALNRAVSVHIIPLTCIHQEILRIGFMKSVSTVIQRTFQPWIWPQFIFKRTTMGRELHDFQSKVRSFFGKIVGQKIKEHSSAMHNGDFECSVGFKVYFCPRVTLCLCFPVCLSVYCVFFCLPFNSRSSALRNLKILQGLIIVLSFSLGGKIYAAYELTMSNLHTQAQL